jgi:transposase
MAKKTRRHFTVKEKAAALKRHFVDKVPVSDLCAELGLHVSVFYDWQKKMFEGELAGGRGGAAAPERDSRRKVDALEARLARKDAVIAEVTGEYVALKKKLGEA